MESAGALDEGQVVVDVGAGKPEVPGELRQRGRADRGGTVNQAGRDIIIHNHIEQSARAKAIPYQLPRDIHDFTGRAGALRKLQNLFAGHNVDSKAIVITAIAGKGGVGKTALAVRCGHLIRELFPDGQLYVNLRGVETARLEPTDVLADFLRTLGIADGEIPRSIDMRERLYRTLVAERRLLVILDNAADEAQVRPLLPGSSSCAVIITSRSRLAALEASYVLVLDALDPDESLALLAKIVGADRVAVESEAASTITRLCGYLPLAVRIAGARLAAHDSGRLAKLATRLGDERRRLDELRVGDLEVRMSFNMSYQSLSPQQRRAFRLLGIPAVPDFTALAGALLLGNGIAAAEAVIGQLVDACLLEVVGEDEADHTRFRFHDLVHVFARECLLRDEEPAEQDAALGRLLVGFLAIAQRGAAALRAEPWQLADRPAGIDALVRDDGVGAVLDTQPLGWFAAERLSLVALIEQAHETGHHELTAALAIVLVDFFDARSHWSEWEHTHELALTSAQRSGDVAAEAWLLRSTGSLYRHTRRFEAVSYLNRSLPLLRRLGDRPGEAAALLDLGLVSREQGRLGEAVQHYQRCVAIYGELGDRRGEAIVLRSLGFVYRDLGRFREAAATQEQCLATFRSLGDTRWEAFALRGLGLVYRGLGRMADALACFEQALQIFRGIGDRLDEAYVVYDLASLRIQEGRPAEALDLFDMCLPVLREHRDQRGESYATMELGLAYVRLGRPADARACYEQCLTALRDLGDVRGEAWGLLYLADLCQSENRTADALVLYGRCQPIFADSGDAVGEARTLQGLGTTLAASRQYEQAHPVLANALARFQEMNMPEAERLRAYLATLA
ncbi:ATP-binding protein [Streptomyces sp. NPDC001984]